MNGILSPDKNPAYGDWTSLPVSLWDEFESLRIEGENQALHDPGGDYRLPLLGDTLLIRPTDRYMAWENTKKEPTFQEGLVALTYLTNFKPIDLSQKWISPSELPGGRTFFGPGSHPPKTDGILSAWSQDPERFQAIVKTLRGDTILEGDEGVQIPSLPKVPLRYVFWRGETTLPPAVTLLVNATAHLFLPLDVLWALINLTDQCFTAPWKSPFSTEE